MIKMCSKYVFKKNKFQFYLGEKMKQTTLRMFVLKHVEIHETCAFLASWFAELLTHNI
jgi:hypothetical protein